MQGDLIVKLVGQILGFKPFLLPQLLLRSKVFLLRKAFGKLGNLSTYFMVAPLSVCFLMVVSILLLVIILLQTFLGQSSEIFQKSNQDHQWAFFLATLGWIPKAELERRYQLKNLDLCALMAIQNSMPYILLQKVSSLLPVRCWKTWRVNFDVPFLRCNPGALLMPEFLEDHLCKTSLTMDGLWTFILQLGSFV